MNRSFLEDDKKDRWDKNIDRGMNLYYFEVKDLIERERIGRKIIMTDGIRCPAWTGYRMFSKGFNYY